MYKHFPNIYNFQKNVAKVFKLMIKGPVPEVFRIVELQVLKNLTCIGLVGLGWREGGMPGYTDFVQETYQILTTYL